MSVIIIVIIIFNGLVRCALRNECYYDYLFYFQVCQGVHYVMDCALRIEYQHNVLETSQNINSIQMESTQACIRFTVKSPQVN